MNSFDVVVIGGGLAGLVGACAAAQRGAKTALLAFGAGSLSIGCGTIDVLGYDASGRAIKSPARGLREVGGAHPYAKIGAETTAEALAWFCRATADRGFPYAGNLEANRWIPTAAGTLKPTCLTPPTVDAEAFRRARRVVVAGFGGLKDFSARLAARNLASVLGDRRIDCADLRCELEDGRDIGAMDVARWLESAPGERSFARQLKEYASPETAIVAPPVLGAKPDCALLNRLRKSLGCAFVEAAALPPAVTGLRLASLLKGWASELGATVIENAKVSAAQTEGGVCRRVLTEHPDRTRAYEAKSFILATGGLYGGGFSSGPTGVVESVFDLPVDSPAAHGDWTAAEFLGPQPFAKFGIRVNQQLQPVNGQGAALLKNVRIAGRGLGGCDSCAEQSGNGVALASAYKAAVLSWEASI